MRPKEALFDLVFTVEYLAGLIALLTGIIGSGFIGELNRAKQKYPAHCPRCGKELDHHQ